MSLVLLFNQGASGTTNYTLSGAVGTYAFSGKAATLTYTPGSATTNYTLSGAYGAYAVSGQSATLTWSGRQQETGGASPNRQKRVYLERDGKILVFSNASRAANYIAAEKKVEAVQEAEKPARTIAPQAPKRAEVRAIHQPQEIIAYDAIAALIQAFNLSQDISALIQRHEIDAIMALYLKARELQDEEDIELLLLAA